MQKHFCGGVRAIFGRLQRNECGNFGANAIAAIFSSDGDTEYKLYAPNVGCVEEIEGKTPLLLKSHETK